MTTLVMISFRFPDLDRNTINIHQKIIRGAMQNWAEFYNIDYRFNHTAITFHVYFESEHDLAIFKLTWAHPEYEYTVFKPNEVGTYVAQ